MNRFALLETLTTKNILLYSDGIRTQKEADMKEKNTKISGRHKSNVRSSTKNETKWKQKWVRERRREKRQ